MSGRSRFGGVPTVLGYRQRGGRRQSDGVPGDQNGPAPGPHAGRPPRSSPRRSLRRSASSVTGTPAPAAARRCEPYSRGGTAQRRLRPSRCSGNHDRSATHRPRQQLGTPDSRTRRQAAALSPTTLPIGSVGCCQSACTAGSQKGRDERARRRRAPRRPLGRARQASGGRAGRQRRRCTPMCLRAGHRIEPAPLSGKMRGSTPPTSRG